VQDLTTLWGTIAEEDYLFIGMKGGPLSGDFLRKKWFGPAAKKLGMTGATVHMLRHTCASLLIRIGTPITTVSAILGHSGVKITLKTYAHFYVEDSFAAMTKLSNHTDSYTE
jgi:integrase